MSSISTNSCLSFDRSLTDSPPVLYNKKIALMVWLQNIRSVSENFFEENVDQIKFLGGRIPLTYAYTQDIKDNINEIAQECVKDSVNSSLIQEKVTMVLSKISTSPSSFMRQTSLNQ